MYNYAVFSVTCVLLFKLSSLHKVIKKGMTAYDVDFGANTVFLEHHCTPGTAAGFKVCQQTARGSSPGRTAGWAPCSFHPCSSSGLRGPGTSVLKVIILWFSPVFVHFILIFITWKPSCSLHSFHWVIFTIVSLKIKSILYLIGIKQF